MKYLHQISLIPLAALILAGCSGPVALQSSTETDDLYYASTDKSVYASNAASVTPDNATRRSNNNTTANPNLDTNTDEVANPEYSVQSGNSNRDNSSTYSDYDYYSDDYTYASRIRRFNSPYRGMSYYDFAYTDPYWYGSGFNAYNPFYDPFYSSGFYRPGFNTGLSLNIGFGNPFYSPFYGYGGGFNRPYGGGYYSGYRNGFYNGLNNGYYANGSNYDRYPLNNRSRHYGPRDERSVVPTTGSNAGGGRAGTNIGGARIPGNPSGRPSRTVDLDGGVAPGGNIGGVKSPAAAGVAQPQTRPGRGARTGIITPDIDGTVNTGTAQPARISTDDNGYQPSSRPVRRRSAEIIPNNEPAPAPPSFPTDVQRSRPARSQRRIEAQPRSVETPRYEAPRREQRAPEPVPQRNDSWSQPSRSSSSPSNNNSGGSNSGGGRPRSRN